MKVFVTGSTQGIGKAIAQAFVARGDEVIVHCTNDIDKAERVRKELGASQAVVADLGIETEVSSLVQKTDGVDCLILNASVQHKESWLEVSAETFAQQFQVNVKSTLRLMQDYFPAMKERGFGRIVTIGSVNQHRVHPELTVYSATKCAVMSMVKNIAKQVAKYGVTVNNVSPGAIATPRNAEVHQNPERCKAVEEIIPLGRFGKAEEIADAVLLLCSKEGEYMTGIDIVIDGGMSL